MIIEHYINNSVQYSHQDQCLANDNTRLIYLISRLVTHLHDFARETRLSTTEWMAALDFLIKYKEFILLSDILGLSLLVASINHPKPPSSTKYSLLGPFYTYNAPMLASRENILDDPEGEPLLALYTMKDNKRNPILGDVDRGSIPSGRCVIVSDLEGNFRFRAIRLDKLITALYIRGDLYKSSDAVFRVKKSLIIDLDKLDTERAKKYDFIIISEEEAKELRD
ncbi:aromatic compound dioxygenase [Sodiomyces alkalinus F11]|uniref:Aromatic compound dioxygenase n=1 Tax=Sodiomyces alkalinus (strain CBS 110278 / VKM F-3762 / F11) TaxID=1314773 RepID=A0A3N2Q3F6_SODAK|nr:aromatic compound dioxygenase [Sodiomyces alkalinus F11]ROT41290.1 aromatic compound dioxygenase [Sodiomyces alkalinus F11]